MIEPADKAYRGVNRVGPVLRLSIVVATAFWLSEAMLHAWVFQTAPDFPTALVPRDGNELWMRALIVGLIVLFGYYAERTIIGIRAANRTLHSVLESTADAYLAVDRRWRLTYLNAKAEKLFDARRELVLGQGFWDVFPEAASSFYKPFKRSMERGEERTFEGFYSARGIWLEVHTTPGTRGMSFYLRDVTERRQREQSLRESNQRLQTILHSAGDGILSIDRHGVIETFNKAAECIFGYSANEAIGCNVSMLMPEPHAGRHSTYIEHYLRTGMATLIGKGAREVTAVRKDGSFFPMDLAVSEMHLSDERYFVGIVRDITERKQAQEALEYISNYDPLTSLPNRSLLRDRLDHALHQAHRDEHLVAIMFLDLDRFKNINDTLGHALGDQLLRQVARRIEHCVREGDTVARLGGDEFVIVLEHINHVDNAALVAGKILDTLTKPMHLSGHEVIVSASIGITIYPFDDDNIDDLLKDADAAMYRAKERGRNNCQYFTADMTAHALEHMHLEQHLRRALERDEFELFYQPQLDLTCGEVIGVEALLRWRHPERGLVSPADFIPILEETGLIRPVGDWVLRTACRQQLAWRVQGLPPLRMAVNLSARQFHQHDLLGTVNEILQETGLDASDLDLEITEGVLVENVSSTVDMLEAFELMGVRLAIDDFGTGYSSLSYLKRFPLHTLKIDQGFVHDVTEDGDSAAIVQAIIALAHSLRLGVIAEGVETEEQLAFLRREGCREVQGYLFCRPLPAAELAEWLTRNHRHELLVD